VSYSDGLLDQGCPARLDRSRAVVRAPVGLILVAALAGAAGECLYSLQIPFNFGGYYGYDPRRMAVDSGPASIHFAYI